MEKNLVRAVIHCRGLRFEKIVDFGKCGWEDVIPGRNFVLRISPSHLWTVKVFNKIEDPSGLPTYFFKNNEEEFLRSLSPEKGWRQIG